MSVKIISGAYHTKRDVRGQKRKGEENISYMSKEKFNIKTEADFRQLMESVDAELRDENTAITARPMMGWLKVSSRFGLGLRMPAPKREPQAGCYTGYDLTIRIFRWFDERYGDRLKMDPTWKMVIMLRGDVYRMRLPLVYGSVQVMCSPEQYGSTSAIPGSRGELPTVNILDLIDDFTEGYAKSLNKDELTSIFNWFQLGFSAKNEIESVAEVSLVREAIGDIEASVTHLFSNPPQYGLSKWASLQATEKIIKAFIDQKGKKFEQTHILDKLATKAEALGLRPIPRPLLDKIQCSPGVRYGTPPVTLAEAVEAHHTALDVCLGVANLIFLHRNYKQAATLEPGKFYTNSLSKEYRCIKVEGDKANIMVFDEVQGTPLEIEFVQDKKYWGQYFEITDPGTTDRLEKRYQFLMAKNPPQSKSKTTGK